MLFNKIFDVILVLVGIIVYGLVWTLGKLLSLMVYVMVLIFSYNGFINEPAVVLGWTIVRDFMNLFIIVALLIIAFATVFKVQAYHYKQMLPKLVIAAVAVNFSKMITGVFIDVSQVVMLTFVYAFQDLAGGNMASLLGIGEILSSAGGNFFSWETLSGNAGFLYVLGSLLLALLLIIVANAVVLVMIVVLAVRTVMLWILTILSPIAWVAPLLPGGQKYASQWWENLTKYLVTGVIMAFFVWLTFASIQIQGKLAEVPSVDRGIEYSDGDLKQGDATKIGFFATGAGTPDSMWSFVIGIAMLMGSLMVAQQLGGVAGSFAGKVSGSLSTAGKLAGRYTLGSAALWAGHKTKVVQLHDFIKGFLEEKKDQNLRKRVGARGKGKSLADTGVGTATWNAAKRVIYRWTKQEDKLEELDRQTEVDKMIAEYGGGDAVKGFQEEQRQKALRSFGGVKAARDDLLHTNSEIKKLEKEIQKKEENGEDASLEEAKLKELENDKIEKEKGLEKAKKEFVKEAKVLFGDIDFEVEDIIEDKDGKLKIKGKDSAGNNIEKEEKNRNSIKRAFVKELKEEKGRKEREKEMMSQGYLSLGKAEQLKQEAEAELKDMKVRGVRSGNYYTRVRDRKKALEIYTKYLRDNKGDKTKARKAIDDFIVAGGEEEEKIIKPKIDPEELEQQLKQLEKDEKDLTIKLHFLGERGQDIGSALGEKLKERYEEILGNIDNPVKSISEEQRRKLLAEYSDNSKKIRKRRADMAVVKQKAMKGFYYQEAIRRQQAEEYQKVRDVENSDELIALLQAAEKKKNKFAVAAILRKLAETANDNEFLNFYGYSSDARGFRKYFDERVKKIISDDQERLRLASDVSFINESRNHWETARVVKYDVKKGMLDWMSEEEHVMSALAEISKMTPRSVAEFNRLAYGGEVEDVNGVRKFHLRPLGVAILNTFARELSRTIERGEMDPNAIFHIRESWDVVKDMPIIRSTYYGGKSFQDWLFARSSLILPVSTRSQDAFKVASY